MSSLVLDFGRFQVNSDAPKSVQLQLEVVTEQEGTRTARYCELI